MPSRREARQNRRTRAWMGLPEQPAEEVQDQEGAAPRAHPAGQEAVRSRRLLVGEDHGNEEEEKLGRLRMPLRFKAHLDQGPWARLGVPEPAPQTEQVRPIDPQALREGGLPVAD